MKPLIMLKSNKGTSIVIYAVSLMVLMGFSAAVADFGTVCIERQRLQSVVDSASLAAAQDLPDTTKALNTANQYAQLNGVSPSDISVTFGDSNKSISISGTKKIDFRFAKLLGINNMTTNTEASASTGNLGAAFDYVLFSGSKTTTLVLNGSDQNVEGNSHTNASFIANGSKLTITGACEAMNNITVNGSQISIGSKVPNAPFVEMPDFSDMIKQQAEAAGTLYSSSKTYNGSNIDVNSPIYVNGSVYVNGSHFKGKGCILATGDIVFNGSNLNQTSGDAVCFYSKSGSIYVNGSNAHLEGIVYAPNGSIIFNGSNQTVNGRVIGNTVYVNGSNLNIIGGSKELASLPSKGVKLVK